MGTLKIDGLETDNRSQAYLALPESTRRIVRQEVHSRLAQFESGGRLVMTAETLIGAGRAPAVSSPSA